MNPSEVLRIVDAIHRDKRIDKEIVFTGVESAIATAAKRRYGEESVIKIVIDRNSGDVSGTRDGVAIEIGELQRIGAQSAKQVMIQKTREAERDAVYEEYKALIDHMVSGVIHKNDGGATIVSLVGSSVEAVLPRSDRIPGENLRINDRIRAVIIDVKKAGNRVKVILSRIRPSLVQKLFETEIPEVLDAVIEIKGISREPGYRTKIAVHSSDQRVDCVGACIGVRGSRIKNITDELNNERIDVVPWSADMLTFIPNALKPAVVEETILCTMLGRAVVLVKQDQRSLAIGRKGQNVRLASKLCGWDVEIMTRDELEADLEKAIEGYALIDGMSTDLADRLVGEGFLSFDDLSIIEPNDLMQMGDISIEEAEAIIAQAEEFAAREEKYNEEKKKERNREGTSKSEYPEGDETEEEEEARFVVHDS